jgi:hypothetical protein
MHIEYFSTLHNGRNIHYGVHMQNTPVKDLIDRWPSRAALASDLEAVIGEPVSVDRVHKWAQAGSIPSGFQAHVIAAASRRGFEITPEEMVRIHAMPREFAADQKRAS